MLMIIKVLTPREDIEFKSQEKKEDEESPIQGFKDSFKKNRERLIPAANNDISNIKAKRKATKNNHGYFKL